ncbi:Nucleoid occlusion protein [subsurface metagenome]
MEKAQLVVEIPIASIRPDPENLRKSFDNDDIVTLGINMKELGQLEPIKVFPNEGGTFDLLDGERRWRAASAMGIPTLRAIVEERPNKETLICKRISRALQTKGLSKQEEVRAIEEALADLGIRDNPEKWSDYADKLGGDLTKVRERMRVANLPSDLRKRFDAGGLDYSMALHLARIPDSSKQREVTQFVTEHDLTTRFAATRFIPKVLESPDIPLMAAYDLARHEERWPYAKPTKTLISEQTTVDKLDELIGSFIIAEQKLEEAAASGDITEISAYESYRDRLLAAVNRLIDVLNAFSRSFQTHYGSRKEQSYPPSLSGGAKSLESGRESDENKP